MCKQVYIIPFECVEHLYDEELGFTQTRKEVKKIGARCGNIVTISKFEREFNAANIDPEHNVIIIE